jgi:tRNA pseudouridine55 synthase
MSEPAPTPAAPGPLAAGGIIVLDKPAGLSSNRALDALKRLLGLHGRGGPKLGYLGTLDPIATGVLPVFVGKATRLIPAFEGLDKTYRATLRLGRRTDTFDADGAVVAEADPGGLDEQAVREAVAAFRGGYEQRVPAFSAVKVGGVPAYRLARQGREVPERVRAVRIPVLELEALALPELTLRLTCSAGTYVRSLAEDIGLRLGVGAHLVALRRLACGCLFTLENSITLVRLEEALAAGDFGFLRNPAAFLPDYLPLQVAEAAERQLQHGRTIALPDDTARLHPAAKMMALRPGGTLVAIGEAVRGREGAWGFQPSKVLL